MGKSDRATTACEKSIQVTIEDSVKGEANYYLGLIAAQEKDIEAAVEHLQTAGELLPDSWTILKKAVGFRVPALSEECGVKCLKEAYFEYQCAYAVSNCCGDQCGGSAEARDPASIRYRLIPVEYGFGSVKYLNRAVKKKRIDIWAIAAKVDRRCKRYTEDCPEGFE
jgi:tetratricopeptide (TPR) repeat protein